MSSAVQDLLAILDLEQLEEQAPGDRRRLGEAHEDPLSELTSRELDVLRLVAAGKPNKEIAAELVISERTARTHVSRILRKLRLSSRTQAALWAVRQGLVEVERDPGGG